MRVSDQRVLAAIPTPLNSFAQPRVSRVMPYLASV